MDTQLTVLELYLRELGQSSAIEDISDRLRIQKAVYLGQLTGADLGYRYSWYLRGPYSTALTQDYYALSEVSEAGLQEIDRHSLADGVKAKLARARSLFTVPEGVDLRLPQWLELLASWHYLLKVSRLDELNARETLSRVKPLLFPHVATADRVLRENGFL